MLSSTLSYAQTNQYVDALPLWADTLEQFVDKQGRTDFKALEKDSGKLEQFLKAIASVSPASNPELFASANETMAYHINSYNALAMWGVIERDIPKNFSSLWKRASFFKFRKVIIGGKKTNLYDYENKVIRPLDEPRSHFALNCMVLDCPQLPKAVFTADSLDQELQAASEEFFSKDKHIRIDHESKELHLSSILKFYTKDFVPSNDKQDLVAYVNQYVKTPIPQDYKVKFIKYDWTVNQQPNRN